MMLSPFVLGFTHTTAMHVMVAIGFVVAFPAALDLWLTTRERTGSRPEVARPRWRRGRRRDSHPWKRKKAGF
jgi:hypothetical protein